MEKMESRNVKKQSESRGYDSMPLLLSNPGGLQGAVVPTMQCKGKVKFDISKKRNKYLITSYLVRIPYCWSSESVIQCIEAAGAASIVK